MRFVKDLRDINTLRSFCFLENIMANTTKYTDKSSILNQSQLAKQSEYLQKLVNLGKTNLEMSTDGIAALERFQNRVRLENAKTSEQTAKMVSKALGKEDTFAKEISHDVSVQFARDDNKRLAYEKASDEDKKFMVNQMKQETIKRYMKNKEFYKENKEFIKNAMVKVESSMDEIVETGSSSLYPIISGFTRTLDSWRSSVLTTVPLFGRLMTDGMMEHYKTGIQEISGHFKTHMSAIMAPIDALTGPLVAVSKSMFTIGKTLFSGPTDYEKESAVSLRDIRNELVGTRKEETKRWWENKKDTYRMWFIDKQERMVEKREIAKRWLVDKNETAKRWIVDRNETAKRWLVDKRETAKRWLADKRERLKAGLSKAKDVGMGMWSALMRLGPMLMAVVPIITAFVTTTLIPAIPIIVGVIAVVMSVGKIVYNLFKDFDKLSVMFKDGDWAGMARLIIADIYDGLLMIPEWLINTALKMFGVDFQVDFGKDAILELYDGVTGWIGGIWDSLMGFFGKVGEVFTSIKDGLMGAAGKIWDKATSWIPGFGDDDEDGEVSAPASSRTPSIVKKESEYSPYYSRYSKGNRDVSFFDEEVNGISLRTSPSGKTVDQLQEDIPTMRKEYEAFLASRGWSEKEYPSSAYLWDREQTEKIDTYMASLDAKKQVVSSLPSFADKDRARAEQTGRQTSAVEDTGRKLDITNSTLTTANDERQRNAIQQTNIMNSIQSRDNDIPTDPENMGMMLHNKTWGLGG